DLRYAAFVLRKGRPVRRVELGDGAALERNMTEWRQDIGKGAASDAVARLRRGLWEPIAQVLGDGVDTVYVCPDGGRAALPWPAPATSFWATPRETAAFESGRRRATR